LVTNEALTQINNDTTTLRAKPGGVSESAQRRTLPATSWSDQQYLLSTKYCANYLSFFGANAEYEAQPMPFFDTLELKYLKSHRTHSCIGMEFTAAIDNRVAAQDLPETIK